MATEGKRDIVIIGGGIIGCTSAYYLTRHSKYDLSKHKITVLEASKIAGGASGKAGGLLALWAYPKSIVPLSYKLHKALSDEHGGEERWGYRTVHVGQVDCVGRNLPEKAEKDRLDGKDGEMDGRNGDTDKEHVSLQKRSKHALGKLRAAGIPAELDWVDADSLKGYDEMGDPTTTAQVHPYQFTTSMAQLAQEKGAEFHEDASVTSINYTPDNTAVESVTYTDKTTNTVHTLPATDIIIAAGPWTRSVYPSAPISALRAHSVTIKPSRPVSAYALFTQIKLPSPFTRGATPLNPSTQIATPEIYARPHNEVYACGDGDHLVPLPATSSEVQCDESRCQDIVDYVGSISDELRDGEVTARQACYLPSVEGSSAPLVGGTGVRGEVLACGHTCWGICNGPGTGKVVGEIVFEGKARSADVEGLDPRGYV
ncbi:Putative oxidoreductase [Fulvia fulva]|uniref:Oxidoreductase n=1 Tax=Passalora fulva TaxID=5499 RepID=A0A9Q8LBL8_PASFU|nr:Putative oxidoreductase [Fulvia fulva]KAK4631016.1 putative oxidoreductase [Fulvia fulva]KAK4633309.1 putative oxidoreductase [Fulvia fulva]UJO14380.1 Putative oxidoreductase [Fulvia fulva]WPV11856.1 Putative oxidoreductase [Fulvia fulva]WPV25727.1 Putative oxidoreductase [Fulvia fulva]